MARTSRGRPLPRPRKPRESERRRFRPSQKCEGLIGLWGDENRHRLIRLRGRDNGLHRQLGMELSRRANDLGVGEIADILVDDTEG